MEKEPNTIPGDFVFTPENLIDNIHLLGPWSAYGLAAGALAHYFPDEYDEDGNCKSDVHREIELCREINCMYWHDVIRKYAKEVGYTGEFHPGAVNEY